MNSCQTVISAMFSAGSSSDDSLAASLMLARPMNTADSIDVYRLAASLMLALLTMLFADAFAVDRLAASSLMLALLTMLSADSIDSIAIALGFRHALSFLHQLLFCAFLIALAITQCISGDELLRSLRLKYIFIRLHYINFSF